ncbi:ParB/RepB/Spo0J family partition protein [Streptomyces sp. NPDC049954]|uniref:ParB/RepB/Spo0J family partition protein n=1 Tax=Streptomyces sp. NPDC049954 TaxID=3155779 RepID=UPI003433D45E
MPTGQHELRTPRHRAKTPEGGLGPEIHRVPVADLANASSPRTSGADISHVRALAELHVALPPVVVHRGTMRVLDGVHRVQAAVLRGQQDVEVRYFEGSEDEAFILAVRLNSAHGKPLSLAERAAAAERIIAAHPEWSDRRIATVTHMSPKTVAAVRGRSTADVPQLNGEPGERLGADGRARPVNPAERRLRAGELVAREPEAPLRRIAREAGVSLATASDVRRRVLQGQDVLPPRLRREGEEGGGGATGGAQPGDGRLPRHPSPPPAFPETPAVLEGMRRDPSVRLSASGRSLLRLLNAHPSGPAEWRRLAGAVPAHRAAPMAEMARSYAESWLQIARILEQDL